MITITTAAWMSLVIFHMMVVLGNVASFFTVPFLTPWYIALPIMSFILITTFGQARCPLTALENALRKQIGKKPIGGFIGHYILRPLKKRKQLKEST